MFLEHVNLTVNDLPQSVRFYRELFGFEVRWEGTLDDGRHAVHVGDEKHYLSLFQCRTPGRASNDYGPVGVNHFGFVVEDLDAMKGRLRSLGVELLSEADYEPGRRLYFLDPNGIEIELVQYEEAPLPR